MASASFASFSFILLPSPPLRSLSPGPISSNTSNQGLPLVACSLGCLLPMRLLKVRQPRHILYVSIKSSFSPSITTPPPSFIFKLCPRFPFPLFMLIHICRIGQAIKSSSNYQVARCAVASRSRFDRQEFCGSGVMSHVEVLAPRVDLHGNTSLSSRQRVCLSSLLSLSPPLSSLPLSLYLSLSLSLSLSPSSPSLALLTC